MVRKKEEIIKLAHKILPLIQSHYGERLITLAIFGSTARDNLRKESDVDFLLILKAPLPSYGKRVKEFMEIWGRILEIWVDKGGVILPPSFLILSETEAKKHPSIFLDMTDKVIILFDRDDFLKRELTRLRKKMEKLGSRKVYTPHGWYWIIKPGIKLGEKYKL